MKNLRLLAFAFCLPFGFTAQAQQETTAPSPRKLEQLYVSLGSGPAVTLNNNSHAWGGNYQVNVTAAWGASSLLRLNVQQNEFFSTIHPKTGPFSYLESNSYHSSLFASNENTVISLAYGRREKLTKVVQLQAFSGIGFNQISQLEVLGLRETRLADRPKVYYKPGLLLQAEVLFLPTKFAGLTLGAYANLTPKMPSAGLNLSLNLGMLERKESL